MQQDNCKSVPDEHLHDLRDKSLHLVSRRGGSNEEGVSRVGDRASRTMRVATAALSSSLCTETVKDIIDHVSAGNITSMLKVIRLHLRRMGYSGDELTIS